MNRQNPPPIRKSKTRGDPKKHTFLERKARAALAMSSTQLRYPLLQAQVMIGVGNTKIWQLVKEGKLRVHYDGSRPFVTHAELERYVASCEANTESPSLRARAVPGVKGVQSNGKQRKDGDA